MSEGKTVIRVLSENRFSSSRRSPSCKRLRGGDECRQRGTSVIAIRAVRRIILVTLRSVYVKKQWWKWRRGEGGGLTVISTAVQVKPPFKRWTLTQGRKGDSWQIYGTTGTMRMRRCSKGNVQFLKGFKTDSDPQKGAEKGALLLWSCWKEERVQEDVLSRDKSEATYQHVCVLGLCWPWCLAVRRGGANILMSIWESGAGKSVTRVLKSDSKTSKCFDLH